MMSLLRLNWRWLLIFSCVPLFATKALFNLPIAVMMVLGGVIFFRNPGGILRDSSVKLLLLVFLCFQVPMLLSLPDAVQFDRAFKTTVLEWRFFFVGVFIIDVLREELARKRLFIAVGGCAVLWSLDALIQIYAGYDLLGYPYNGVRPTGIFHPNYRIGIVTAALSPLIFEMIRLGGRRRRWLWFGLPVVFALIILGGSRNAWMMLTVSSFLYVIYLYFVVNRKQLVVMMSFAASVLFLVGVVVMQYPPLKDRLDQSLGVFSGSADVIDKATGRRFDLWKTAWNMYLSNPVNGVGPRGYRYVYIENADKGDFFVERMDPGSQNYPQNHPHQLVLEIAAETGTIGLVGFVLMIWLYLRAAIRSGISESNHLWPWVLAVMVAWFPGNSHLAVYGSYWSTVAWWLIVVSIAYMHFSKPTQTKS